jgi:hypothetical protein
MRDLWKALAMVALDNSLRDAIDAAKAFDTREEFTGLLENQDVVKELKGLNLQNQPNLASLRTIDAEFRKRGLFVAVYGLAEINRWFIDGNTDFLNALQDLKEAVSASAAIAAVVQSPGYLESIGALVADPVLRDQFQKNETTLQDNGFIISPAEAKALKADFTVGSKADSAAAKIRALGWSGGVCFSTFYAYSGMVHLNM